MNPGNPPSFLRKVAILVLSSTIAANAADSFSDADKAFVAKVVLPCRLTPINQSKKRRLGGRCRQRQVSKPLPA